MENPFEAEYLGDGLYAQFDGYQIELYAFNGACKTARVFLDVETLRTFEKYLQNVRNLQRAKMQPNSSENPST